MVTSVKLIPPLALILTFLTSTLEAQKAEKSVKPEKETTEYTKTGWTFGGVPAIAYDRDVGFRYGAIVNFYNFGDGSRYPKYDHSIFLQYSRTTKGSTVSQFTYDSDRLLPGIRTSAEATFETEQALDFYGFNGYSSRYNKSYETDEDIAGYISRMFYRQERKLLRLKAHFSGEIIKSEHSSFCEISQY